MAKLTVQAAPFANPVPLKETTESLYVSVSVSDESGNAVDGLKDSEFSITILAGPPNPGATVGVEGQLLMALELSNTFNSGPGFYSVEIAPSASSSHWLGGGYVLGLTVKDRKTRPSRPGSSPIQAPAFTTDNGQTLVVWNVT